MDNHIKELEKQKEENDKRLLMLEWVIGILSCLVFAAALLIGELVPMEDWQRVVIILLGVIPAIFGLCIAIRIEQIAGYYECKHCKNRYVPTYKAVNLAPHIGRTRYMKCPKCGKRSWQKKVIGNKARYF